MTQKKNYGILPYARFRKIIDSDIPTEKVQIETAEEVLARIPEAMERSIMGRYTMVSVPLKNQERDWFRDRDTYTYFFDEIFNTLYSLGWSFSVAASSPPMLIMGPKEETC